MEPDPKSLPTPLMPRRLPVDWDDCREPTRMVLAAGPQRSPRKLRLFACAAARRVWDLLPDWRTRAAVEVAERFADGLATPIDLREAQAAAWAAFDEAVQAVTFPFEADPWWYGRLRGYHAGGASIGTWVADPELGMWTEGWEVKCEHFLEQLESGILFAVAHAAAPLAPDTPAAEGLRLDNCRSAAGVAERIVLVQLVRCLFSHPAKPVRVEPAWRAPAVRSVAEAIYAGRAYERMPLLADALHAAGCEDAQLLGHCREPGPHARGCRVIDLVMGRG